MTNYPYVTVDVFTRERFGGNQLAVFYAAEGLGDREMQSLAAEMNYSETTFVLPPADPANTARVRIFNRTAEMPFAGHPNVGTAFALASLGRCTGPTLRFEEMAGIVEVQLLSDGGAVVGAEIEAPQPLSILDTFGADDIAACIALPPPSIVTARHEPVRATLGVDFVIVEVAPDALSRASPDIAAFRRLADANPALGGRLSIFLYAADGDDVRARMFGPLSGTWEDPATGSANATLAALRLSIAKGEALSYRSVQGVEMGRRSELGLRAWRATDGYRASVAGFCVPVFRGEVLLGEQGLQPGARG